MDRTTAAINALGYPRKFTDRSMSAVNSAKNDGATMANQERHIRDYTPDEFLNLLHQKTRESLTPR